MIDMSRMIFVTGFARGGTSWLRDCIASHPDVQAIPEEMVLFREHGGDRDAVVREISEKVQQRKLAGPWFVNKAPANAPHIDKACRALPESKFLFIVRDPRDVFISHKRGNAEWMKGKNSTIDGCMHKTQLYYQGYLRARDLPNVMLVRYEDLHQDFHATLESVYRFIGLRCDDGIVEASYKANNFISATGRKHAEDRDAAKRKGVVGDWVNFLEPAESDWLKRHEFWPGFMQDNRYRWEPITYGSIVRAMKEAGVHDMSEEDLYHVRLDMNGRSMILVHDVDLLNSEPARRSLFEMARIEGRLGVRALYNFLPLDDMRYQPLKPKQVVEVIHEVLRLNPLAFLGLHLNAAEGFFPKDAPEVGDDHPLMVQAVAYLHQQVDDYERHGFKLRVATAHGYGRAKKVPNNRDSDVFPAELQRRGILMYDRILGPDLNSRTSCRVNLSDVGGSLCVEGILHSGAVDDPETYRKMPAGTFIRFLTHPGNYDTNRPLTLGVRINRPPLARMAARMQAAKT